MDLAVCRGGSFASAESPSDVAADDRFPGIAHCVIFAFVTTAYMVSEPLPTQFFLPHGGSAVFADCHFRAGRCAALRLPVGVPSASGGVIRSFCVSCRLSLP